MKLLKRPLVAILVALAFASTMASAQRARSAAPVELDQAKQKAIWDYEHYTFVLEEHLGKPFARALQARNAEELGGFFLPDFEAEAPTPSSAETRKAGTVTERRVERSSASAGEELDAAAFVAYLMEVLRPITDFERARLNVTHIERDPGAETWRTTVLLTAFGAGKQGQLVDHVSRHTFVFQFGNEDQIKTGKVIARARVDSVITRTSPRPVMLEVTESTGLAELPLLDNWLLTTQKVRPHRYQVAVDDFDRDGWLDIAVGQVNGKTLLLRSIRGERFDNVATELGLRALRPAPREVNSLTVWIDYDDDGFPDLLNGYRLYRNVEGKRFEDVTSKARLAFEKVPFGALVFDYDGDGRLDLYVLNQKGFEQAPPGKRPWVGDEFGGTQNHLWRNKGDGTFENVTKAAGAAGGRHQTFAGANFFLDDDAFPDVYLANDFGENVLLRNKGDGTFEDVTAQTRLGDYSTSMGVAAGDLDNDGRTELYVANMYSKMGRRIIAHVSAGDYPDGIYEMVAGSLAGNRLYKPGAPGGPWQELSDELDINAVGWSHATTMVDLDGNGWLDLYSTAGYISQRRDEPDG